MRQGEEMVEKTMIVGYEIQHIRSEISRAKAEGLGHCDIYGELFGEAIDALYCRIADLSLI